MNDLPTPPTNPAPISKADSERTSPDLRHRALAAWQQPSPAAKCAAVTALQNDWLAGQLTLNTHNDWPEHLRQQNLDPLHPGQPPQPRLLPPTQMPKRSTSSKEGHVAMMHAIAHIEFNAINLALDAIWRYPNLPPDYYTDWLQVASEEAYHFQLVSAHLSQIPRQTSAHWAYGDLPAHSGLWDMCVKTHDDVCARMALVPRTLEARGLDATPQIAAKLHTSTLPYAADALSILDIILRDEIGHVAIGNRWYHYLCDQRSLDPITHYAKLCQWHNVKPPKPPFNTEARLQAGFTAAELSKWQGNATTT